MDPDELHVSRKLPPPTYLPPKDLGICLWCPTRIWTVCAILLYLHGEFFLNRCFWLACTLFGAFVEQTVSSSQNERFWLAYTLFGICGIQSLTWNGLTSGEDILVYICRIVF